MPLFERSHEPHTPSKAEIPPDKVEARVKGEPAEVKIEDISFNSHKKNHEISGEPVHEKHKRKEINLSELRKALEESLSPKNSKEELEQRVQEENYEDKTSFPDTEKK